MSFNNDDAFLGRGWSYPTLFRNQGKDLVMAAGPENIHKSIWIILNTQLGERVLRESFGAGFQRLYFEPLSSRMVNDLKRLVSNAILLHEPRVQVDRVLISANDAENGVLLIEINYTIRANNTRFNLVYPFYRALDS